MESVIIITSIFSKPPEDEYHISEICETKITFCKAKLSYFATSDKVSQYVVFGYLYSTLIIVTAIRTIVNQQ